VTSAPWKVNVMESALAVDAILHTYAYDKAWPQMRATHAVARKRASRAKL
jgi:hypothetical protein